MWKRPIVVAVADAGSPASASLAAWARDALFERAPSIRVLVRLAGARPFSFEEGAVEREGLDAVERGMVGVLEGLRGAGAEVALEVVVGGVRDALARVAVAERCDGIVVLADEARWPASLRLARDAATRTGRPVALVAAPPSGARWVSTFDGKQGSLASIGAFLREHGRHVDHLTMLALAPVEPGLPNRIEASPWRGGEHGGVEFEAVELPLVGQDAVVAAFAARFDAVLVPAELRGSLAARRAERLALASHLVFFAPPLERLVRSGRLLTTDGWVHDGGAYVRIELDPGLGGSRSVDSSRVMVVAAGAVRATVDVRAGRVLVPVPPDDTHRLVGLGRIEAADPREPLAAVECSAWLVRPEGRRVLLVDAGLPVDVLTQAAGLASNDTRLVVAVRLAPTPLDALRGRLGATSLPLVDARDLLDEDAVDDVPREALAVRLARCAARLRASGVAVDAVLVESLVRPHGLGFAVLAPEGLDSFDEAVAAAYAEPPDDADGLARRLVATTGAAVQRGHRIGLAFDNAEARAELLAAIAGARSRVHAQWYIVEDDAVGREIEAALADAARRGVAVRVLVDSLYSLHGSLGRTNPLLERLGSVPGVRVRAVRPLPPFPGLADLKRRDHRKLVVVDGALAIVSGRNLGAAYYTGFHEAKLGPRSPWKDVPWVDASIRVEGPAVRSIDASFLKAFTEAGGEAFPLLDPLPCGSVPVRVVVHEGLRDACTLDAYVACIDAAERCLDLVHGFPLQFEVRSALARALARGVRVRIVIGHVRPTHGPEIPFEGAGPRDLADALVRGRLDPLLASGAELYEVALTRPAWDPALGTVRPHVHAKLLVSDGRLCAIGSANLDVTAGYWESEILVVVDDAEVGGRAERGIATLLEECERIDRDGLAWREGLALRDFLSRHWPGVIG